MLEFEKPLVELENKIKELKALSINNPELAPEIQKLEKKLEKMKEKVYSNLSRWDIVQVARHPDRPHSIDYIKNICDHFFEIKGDRNFRDDPAIIAGIAKISGISCVIVAEEKGRTTKEKIERNFGMPHPEGYRKAIRAFNLAEKFGVPVMTLVDTPGAYPGLGAEERGQAWAISESIYKMISLRVPVISFIIGEGGSGGAFAIAVADKVYALEFSIYSVISPEGCAAILFRDASKAKKAAEVLKLTAKDLLEFGVIDGIIKEPPGGAHRAPEKVFEQVKRVFIENYENLSKIPIEEILRKRREKYVKIGIYKNGFKGHS